MHHGDKKSCVCAFCIFYNIMNLCMCIFIFILVLISVMLFTQKNVHMILCNIPFFVNVEKTLYS